MSSKRSYTVKSKIMSDKYCFFSSEFHRIFFLLISQIDKI
jgi:hypothetical protein